MVHDRHIFFMPLTVSRDCKSSCDVQTILTQTFSRIRSVPFHIRKFLYRCIVSHDFFLQFHNIFQRIRFALILNTNHPFVYVHQTSFLRYHKIQGKYRVINSLLVFRQFCAVEQYIVAIVLGEMGWTAKRAVETPTQTAKVMFAQENAKISNMSFADVHSGIFLVN